jgi:hypothetical protein
VTNSRPGGRIVTLWGTPYYNGALLALTVDQDGTARGRLVAPVSFMMLRDQRVPRVSVSRYVHPDDSALTGALTTTTDLHPYRVAGHYDGRVAIGIPRCRYLYRPADPSKEGVLWFFDPWSRSWASLHHVPDVAADSYQVCQFGPRRLWTEVETAYRQWVAAGEPAVDRWRFTITPQGQQIGLSTG